MNADRPYSYIWLNPTLKYMKKNLTLFATVFSALSLSAQLITATGNTAVARMWHSSQMLSNGKVVVFGGYNGNAQSPVHYSSAEIYNNGTWSYTGAMNEQRYKVSSALLSNGNILAIGGTDANLNETSSCEIYNATSGTWSYTDSMANVRSNAKVVTLNNGKILVAGGQYTATCELYDQSTNTWSTTGTMNGNRYDGFALTKLPDGRVLATGGNNTNTAEIYDPSTGQWTNVTATMTTNHQYHQSILMSNNKVLIAGGDMTLSSEIYDPVAGTFTAAGNLLHYISNCPMVNLSNGKVLVFGIGTLFSMDREALQVFNPVANQWYLAGPVPSSIFTAAVYTVHQLQSGNILYVDGNFTTGNGASQYCYLVNPAAIAVGIDEESSSFSASIFPNPSSGIITVSADVTNGSLVYTTVRDVLGKTVAASTQIAGSTGYIDQIDISGLNPGMYFVEIASEGRVATQQLIKE